MGSIDWTAAARVFSLTKDLLLGAGAIVTAGVAVIGLNRWARELSGKAEFEAVPNLITVTYKIRDVLAQARWDVLYSYEFAERLNMRDMTPDEIAETYGYMP